MHWIRLITFVILPLLLALAAPVLILWAWGNDWPLLPALLAGIMFLAAAVVVHLSGQLSQSPLNEEQEALWHELHALRRKVDALVAQPQPREPVAAERQTPGVEAPGSHEAKPEANIDGPVDSVRKEPASAGADTNFGMKRPAPADTGGDAALDGYQLYMEPVVDMANGQTALYRAHPALPADGDRVFLGRHAQLRARTLGRAAALQARTLDGCLSFARRLRARGAAPGVICPLDVAVLAQDGVVEQLQRLIEASPQTPQAAQAILFAVPFNDLAQSSREARMHLMMLAQSVAGFVIDHDGVLAPDAPLPLPLPVRYVDVPGRALALAGGLSDMGALAARYHERGWQIIASDIMDEATARQVAALAGLARGGHYSPPRRVREEALAPADAAETTGGDDGDFASHLRMAAAR